MRNSVAFVIAMLAASHAVAQPAPQPTKQPAAPAPSPDGQGVYGLYCSGFAAGSEKMFSDIVEIIDRTYLNAVVIDVKGDSGRLSYKSEVPLARKYGSGQAKIKDIAGLIRTLKDRHIIAIARIVAFKDQWMAEKNQAWAVRDIDGGVWKDRKGAAWIDPYNRKYWDYLVEIAEEAVRHGFVEIQFDYVRFTSDGDTSRCVYPARTRTSKQDLIAQFLEYASRRLRPSGVKVSADIFGLATSTPGDMGIGQNLEKIAHNTDIVCPMVYPSHYGAGNLGIADPDRNPYRTVFRGVSDGMARLDAAGLKTVMRPWLQAFSIKNRYGKAQIADQVRATIDAGAREWLFWNAGCVYKLEWFQEPSLRR